MLTDALRILQRREGKVEIKFSASDNVKVEKVCLVFIKIPVNNTTGNVIKTNIRTDKKPPLSKGRLDIQTLPKSDQGMFIGILRVKDMTRLYRVINELVQRMDNVIQQSSVNTQTHYQKRESNGTIFGLQHTTT